MGTGASSAVGPSGYSLDDLLKHWSETGALTAGKLCEVAQAHFDVAATPEQLWKLKVIKLPGAAGGGASPAAGGRAVLGHGAPPSGPRPRAEDVVVLELDAFHDYVMKIVVRKGNEVTFVDKPCDLYSLISPLEARSGFPRALAAVRANPKLAGQPMRGHGSGSSWLPLHCLLLLGPKFQGWWWPLAEPLFQSLLSANPRAAQQRVLEGVPYPFGHLPLELAVTRGWDARVVTKVHGAYRAAASTLDPVSIRAAKGCENPNFKGSYISRSFSTRFG